MAKASVVNTQIMGILNVTPDSFYDGGRHHQRDQAIDHAHQMHQDGAHLIDIGGESTRPGAQNVTVDEELDRVVPVVAALSQRWDVPLSVDTQKVPVMEAVLKLGVHMINDVNALQAPGARALLAQYPNTHVCLMHRMGTPQSMQHQPHYHNITQAVMDFLMVQAKKCTEAGIQAERIVLDPGIGFGKTVAHNLQLIHDLNKITSLGFRVLLGLSRKFFIGRLLGSNPQNTHALFTEGDVPTEQRLYGSIAATTYAVQQGVDIIRTHDVKATAHAITITQALLSVS